MDVKGQAHSQWGFTNPEPGWYAMEFTGDNVEKTNEETGKTNLRIPLKITGGDYDGSQQSIFITLNPQTDGESKANKRKVGNILAACKLDEAFEKKFPGDVSALDKAVIDAMKVKIAGKTVMVRLENVKSKDGKEYLNIMEMAPADFKPEVKGKGDSPKPTPAQAADTGDW